MKSHLAVGLIATVVLAGCQKNDATPTGASSAAVAQAAPAGALKDFEGEVDLLVKSVKETKPIPPIAILVKGTKLRFDVPEGMEHGPKFPGKAYMIVNTVDKKLYAVVDAQRQVVVMDLANMGQQMKQWNPSRPGETEAPPKVTKTGHTDTVAGYTCENWDVVSAKGEHSQLCVSDQSTSWFQLPGINLPSEQTWAKELVDGNHLPLRMIGYDAAGTEESRLEVEKLEKKPVSDSVFDIPTTYRQMDLAEIMKAVMGGMGMQPGEMPSGLPPGFPAGMQLPPGATLPPGMQLPPGMKLPPGMQIPPGTAEMLRQMQERARAAQMPPLPPAAK